MEQPFCDDALHQQRAQETAAARPSACCVCAERYCDPPLLCGPVSPRARRPPPVSRRVSGCRILSPQHTWLSLSGSPCRRCEPRRPHTAPLPLFNQSPRGPPQDFHWGYYPEQPVSPKNGKRAPWQSGSVLGGICSADGVEIGRRRRSR